MSYNITGCKVKELTNLVLPISVLYANSSKNYQPDKIEVVDPLDGTVAVRFGEVEIEGTLAEGKLHVTSMDLRGEGSGVFMHYCMNPALKESTGTLKAKLVWEGGDTISTLTCVDGQLNEEEED